MESLSAPYRLGVRSACAWAFDAADGPPEGRVRDTASTLDRAMFARDLSRYRNVLCPALEMIF
jgi:hypothetical protein